MTSSFPCRRTSLQFSQIRFTLQRFDRFLVVSEGRSRLVEGRVRAKAITDIRQVAQGARQVALFDVGIQVARLVGANGLDEVAEVIAAAGELLDLLTL